MRLRMMVIAACAVVLSGAVQALEFREEPYRVGVIDVGQPILLEYPELTNEMNLNIELRDWIETYGRPEYAEYQKVAFSEPFLPYEIRLYYIEGRSYVAFGRVSVSPVITDYGVRKYIGKLDSAMLQRLLTARPLDKSPAYTAGHEPSAGARYSGTWVAAAPEPAVVRVAPAERVVVEEVVEIISPETVMLADAPVTGASIVTGAAAPPVEVEATIVEVETAPLD